MPRIRSIKPQFWLDENLGSITRDARLLYIGLWNLADDYGVFEWRPARIKIQLFPWDADITGEKIEEWLQALIGTGDIIQFDYEGKDYGYIRSFLEHQLVKKPSQWRFAPPPVGDQLLTTTPPVPLRGRGSNKDKSKSEEMGEGEVEPTPSLIDSSILKIFLEKFPYAFGREPDSREQAQLRDLAEEISQTDVTEKQIHDAFREAAAQNKHNVSYLRAILLAWLGVEK